MVNVWEKLDQDSIFSSIEGVIGGDLSGLLIQRNSYINRVYEIERSDNGERLIVKFYRPGRWTRSRSRKNTIF